MPCATFRAWFLGIIWAILIPVSLVKDLSSTLETNAMFRHTGREPVLFLPFPVSVYQLGKSVTSPQCSTYKLIPWPLACTTTPLVSHRQALGSLCSSRQDLWLRAEPGAVHYQRARHNCRYGLCWCRLCLCCMCQAFVLNARSSRLQTDIVAVQRVFYNQAPTFGCK